MTHQFLYYEAFEREEYNLFPSKNIPLDWIIWYDCYNKKFQDPLYSYGYRLHTARYLHDPNYKFEQGLIQFSRASNQVLVETKPTYLHKVYSRYTTYDYNQGKSILVPYNNILVQQNFEKDHLSLHALSGRKMATLTSYRLLNEYIFSVTSSIGQIVTYLHS